MFLLYFPALNGIKRSGTTIWYKNKSTGQWKIQKNEHIICNLESIIDELFEIIVFLDVVHYTR